MANAEKNFTPKIPEMVTIPMGSFLMGSPGDDLKHFNRELLDRELPQVEIRLEHGFQIGKTAVTIEAFSQFIEDTGYDTGDEAMIRVDDKWPYVKGAGWHNPGYDHGPEFPVTCVNFHDVSTYIDWLNERMGLTGQPNAFCLPSEAEWEYACRAGTTTAYWFGDTPDVAIVNYSGQKHDDSPLDDTFRCAAVETGSLPANPFGLHEMHGNTWDWCADVWSPTHHGALTDGRPRIVGEQGRRTIRGGSWDYPAEEVRSAFRWGHPEEIRYSDGGFRLARRDISFS